MTNTPITDDDIAKAYAALIASLPEGTTAFSALQVFTAGYKAAMSRASTDPSNVSTESASGDTSTANQVLTTTNASSSIPSFEKFEEFYFQKYPDEWRTKEIYDYFISNIKPTQHTTWKSIEKEIEWPSDEEIGKETDARYGEGVSTWAIGFWEGVAWLKSKIQ